MLDVKKIIEKSFKIEDQPSNGVVRLTGSYKGEKIEVKFDCQDTEDQEMEDQEEGEQTDDDDEEAGLSMGVGISFEVSITKGDKKMFILCSGGEQLMVRNIRMLRADQTGESVDCYGGPTFEDLEESLQDELLNYLADRNINDDLAFFVLSYGREKEQKEYLRWLKSVEEFTA